MRAGPRELLLSALPHKELDNNKQTLGSQQDDAESGEPGMAGALQGTHPTSTMDLVMAARKPVTSV